MNFLRQIVSGKKNRMKEAGYNLDLTYVCPRVIAMSFPAEGLEVTFRNNISDVVSFVKERHGSDFHIYNLSGRPYDIKKFDGQVSDFVRNWDGICLLLGVGGPSFSADPYFIQAVQERG